MLRMVRLESLNRAYLRIGSLAGRKLPQRVIRHARALRNQRNRVHVHGLEPSHQLSVCRHVRNATTAGYRLQAGARKIISATC